MEFESGVAVTVPFYNGKRRRAECGNSRGIKLLSVDGKRVSHQLEEARNKSILRNK